MELSRSDGSWSSGISVHDASMPTAAGTCHQAGAQIAQTDLDTPAGFRYPPAPYHMEPRMSSVAVPRPAATGPWARIQDLILPIGMVASILVILTPVPAGLMDLLLAANITIAVMMLLTTLYVRTPLEFNIFPVAAAGDDPVPAGAERGHDAADSHPRGHRRRDGGGRRWFYAFGNFVTGGDAGGDNVVVGLVIFSIIVLIQFVVITKGATRISEVAARFTLDGMPGKQMAIDADLNAGVIDQHEAQRRRQEITQQADFFGAMDGASKFVRGDAIAGIVIILINIIGGLFIGIVQNGMSLGEAASLFTTLTIGDGLVTQVPAFLISLAAGMLVTRSSQASNLPSEFLRQLFSRPQALAVAGGFLGRLDLHQPAADSAAADRRGLRGHGRDALPPRNEGPMPRRRRSRPRPRGDRSSGSRTIWPSIRWNSNWASGLIRLADPKRGGDLLERIQRVRQSLAAEIGIILPKVRVRDNMRLEQNQYRIKIADMAVAQGSLDANVLDPGNTLAAHLSETVRRHADELLTRDAVKHLLDELRQTSPAVVDELIPGVMKLGEVQRVLQTAACASRCRSASWSRFWRRSATMPRARRTRSSWPSTSASGSAGRFATATAIQAGRLHVVTLDPALEERIRAGVERSDDGLAIRLSPRDVDEICRRSRRKRRNSSAAGRPPIVLVSPSIRPAVKQLTAAHLPQLVVLSYDEITRDTKIESVGMVADACSRTAGSRQ